VAKLVALLGLTRTPGQPAPPAADRAVVLVGPYEHHSNELPWRESTAEVVAIRADERGRVDLADLQRQLRRFAGRPLLVGSFSAASNVTGILTDTDAVAALLHRYGALACFDYAAAGPYVPIRMAPSLPGGADGKDAIFLSPHKFLGGPQSPGVLVAHRRLLTTPVPTVPGGGTITFVGPDIRRYAPDPVAREEGGTPAIVESIRAGLAFQLKAGIGTDAIHAAHQRLLARALDGWRGDPAIELLGDLDVPRLPIVSLRIRHGRLLLHHAFVVAVLNDLFGIQARGGCSCAGPYGHRLLGIGPAESAELAAEVDRGHLGIKPGWTRITFHYTMTDRVADFIVEAVRLVAAYGHRLLGEYTFDPATGRWRHRSAPTRPAPVSFPSFAQGLVVDGVRPRERFGEHLLAGYLDRAREILASRPPSVDSGQPGMPDTFERLRRFHLPPRCLA
jgi:selenocysteine lyase/cysteine desulfurase